jgi:hypothetical protein
MIHLVTDLKLRSFLPVFLHFDKRPRVLNQLLPKLNDVL